MHQECDGHGAGCVHHWTPDEEPDAVTRMFAWWNRAYADNAFTEAGFARFFTDDAVFLIDGIVRARGPAGLLAYFQRIRDHSDAVVLHAPEDSFVSGDRVFVHYRTSVRAGGTAEEHDIMAAVRVAFGRIAFFKAIRRIEPTP
ncbi:nuclear transport factor 2 family protein [Sphingomonas oryzagri]|uniref:Nuclear transport factor 2 family protein n=1 Tax=Sphingomonas oryzagri TaxID=3042314 RepID=A0ABT6N3X5_9SPHN|nr:nuclear transport factor 2 family protein [Sphingomonas oryzagri]MDH7640000.1 nuclear transport factor 2 family protein [Sphingomonas oryzagri]